MALSLAPQPQSPQCRVRVLGPCEIAIDGTPVQARNWPRKGVSLLRMLAVSPGHCLPGDEVIDRLWPETTQEAGNSSLKNLVYRMRRSSADGNVPVLLLLDKGQVMLNPECAWHVDAEDFLALAAGAGNDVRLLQDAVALYRGEPLIEDRYDDWPVDIRLRLQNAYRAVSLRLATLSMSGGAASEAVPVMERWLQVDPFDEEALRVLLSALSATSRHIEALRRFERFAQVLREELDAAPSVETVDLAEAIRTYLARDDVVIGQMGAASDASDSQSFGALTLLPLSVEPPPPVPASAWTPQTAQRIPAIRRAALWGMPLLLLVGIAIGLTQGLWPQTSYDRGSPQGTAALYFRLLQDGRVDDAFALTSPSATGLDRRRFHLLFDTWGKQAHRITFLRTDPGPHTAKIAVELTTFNGDLLGGSDRVDHGTVVLTQHGSSWQVESAPFLQQ